MKNAIRISLLSLALASTLQAQNISCLKVVSQAPSREFTHPLDHYNIVEKLGLGYLRQNSPEVVKWVLSENKATLDFLSTDINGKPSGLYDLMKKRHQEITAKNPPPVVRLASFDILTKAGGLVLKNQNEEVVLVPKLVDDKGSVQVVSEFRVSPDANYVAYAYNRDGLDVSQWYILDLNTRKTIYGPFDIRMLEFNWASDSKSFFYTKNATLEEAAKGMRYAHNYQVRLDQLKPELVFAHPDKESIHYYGIESFVNSLGELQLIAYRTQGVAEVPNSVYIRKEGTAQVSKGEFQMGPYRWVPLIIPNQRNLGRVIGVIDGQILVRSAEVGNNFGLMKINPETGKKTVFMKARDKEVLQVAQLIGENLYLQYSDVNKLTNIFEVFGTNGERKLRRKMSDLDPSFPDTGSMTPVVGHKSSSSVYFTYADVALPAVTIEIKVNPLTIQVLESGVVNFDRSKVRYKLKHAVSQDGMKVDYKFWDRKDLKKPRAIYVYAYSFIGIPQFGQWNRKFQGKLDQGAATAIVCARGGGEKGCSFQVDFKTDLFSKMNDFVAVVKQMRQDYPGTPIFFSGRSFGGLLSLLLAVHHPDLFDGYVSVVPVASLMEFFNHGLFGRFAHDDFGVPRNPDGSIRITQEWIEKLLKADPFQQLANMDPSKLKNIILFAGRNDERVGLQARMFIAAFKKIFPQHAHKIHLYEEPANGHVGRTEFAEEDAFIGKLTNLSAEEFAELIKGMGSKL